MTMTLEPAPIVTTVSAAIRCDGKRKDGARCNYLLARIEADAFVGRIELACPKCHKRTMFE